MAAVVRYRSIVRAGPHRKDVLCPSKAINAEPAGVGGRNNVKLVGVRQATSYYPPPPRLIFTTSGLPAADSRPFCKQLEVAAI